VITGAPGNFDRSDALTYNHSTSVNVFDSLGDSHIMTYYFVKEAPVTDAAGVTTNPWSVFSAVDDAMIDLGDPAAPGTQPVTGAGNVGARMSFSTSGDFVAQDPAIIQSAALGTTILSNGADPTQRIVVDFNLDTAGPNSNEPTQFASNFEVTSLEQNGLAVGRLTGLEIGEDGLVRAKYSNGTSEPLSRIAMVGFANNQGLSQVGATSWKQSISSGEGLAGEAGTGTFGTINSSAVEQSNVNLTAELIDLIAAQRNFQANSRSLEIDNQLNQTILQIR
jgi:flagellar hook protein FlgE